MIRLLTILILALAGLFTAMTALTQVQPGEIAIVRRFGRILPEHPGPGLHLGWPWGIDQVRPIKVDEERRVKVGYTGRFDEETWTPAGQLLTGDHNLVNVDVNVDFQVAPGAVEAFFQHEAIVDGLIARTAESALAELIAARTVDAVLTLKHELPIPLRERIRERLKPYRLGVDIKHVSIDLTAPTEVKAAFDQVAQAHAAKEQAINEAEQKANDRVQKAEAQCVHIERLALAEAKQQKLQAQADAEDFRKRFEQYLEFSKNPQYLANVWLDEMTRLFATMKDTGRIDVLDLDLTTKGINIIQPFSTKKK